MQKHVVELANVNFSSEQKQITSTKGLQLLGAIYIHHTQQLLEAGPITVPISRMRIQWPRGHRVCPDPGSWHSADPGFAPGPVWVDSGSW